MFDKDFTDLESARDLLDTETLFVLDELKRWFNVVIEVRGEGSAVDIVVNRISPSFVYEYLSKLYPDRYGVGQYETFTHLDTKMDRTRWSS